MILQQAEEKKVVHEIQQAETLEEQVEKVEATGSYMFNSFEASKCYGSPASWENGWAGGGWMWRNVWWWWDKLWGWGGWWGWAWRFGNGWNGWYWAAGWWSTGSWAYWGWGGWSGWSSWLWGTGWTGWQGWAWWPTTTWWHGWNGWDWYYWGNGWAWGTSSRQSWWNTNHGGAGWNGWRWVIYWWRGWKPWYWCGWWQVWWNGWDAITNFYWLSINARCVSWTGCIRANWWYMVETEQVLLKLLIDTIGELEETVETELMDEESSMLICTELQKQSTSADELEENDDAENIIVAELQDWTNGTTSCAWWRSCLHCLKRSIDIKLHSCTRWHKRESSDFMERSNIPSNISSAMEENNDSCFCKQIVQLQSLMEH